MPVTLDVTQLEAIMRKAKDPKKVEAVAFDINTVSAKEMKIFVEAQMMKKVDVITGRYHASAQIGEPYVYDGMYAQRVYSSYPTAHLLEFGHRILTRADKAELNAMTDTRKQRRKYIATMGLKSTKPLLVFDAAGTLYAQRYAANAEEYAAQIVEEVM